MNLFLLMVTKNESSRYLQQFIDHHDFFDDVFVYDDRSEDDTAEIASQAGWNVQIRSEEDPSFMEHEGKFRFNSWKSFESSIKPQDGDWILSIDADEFIITESDLTIRETILHEIGQAEDANKHLIRIFRREIWKIDDTGIYLRIDGFWRNDIIYRLFKYREGGTWSKKPMGCGSAPKYVGMNGPISDNLFVLHFGHTNSEDRQHRYDRYMSLPDHGHNDKHIKSIISTPVLKIYKGPKPDWLNK